MRFEQFVICLVTWIDVTDLRLIKGSQIPNKLSRPGRFLEPKMCTACIIQCPRGYLWDTSGCYLCACADGPVSQSPQTQTMKTLSHMSSISFASSTSKPPPSSTNLEPSTSTDPSHSPRLASSTFTSPSPSTSLAPTPLPHVEPSISPMFFPSTSKAPPSSTSLELSTSKPPLPTASFAQSTVKPPLTTTRFAQSTVKPPLTTTRFAQSTVKPPLTTTILAQSTIKPPLSSTTLFPSTLKPLLPSPTLFPSTLKPPLPSPTLFPSTLKPPLPPLTSLGPSTSIPPPSSTSVAPSPSTSLPPSTSKPHYVQITDPCIASQKYCNQTCDGNYVKGPGGCEYCFCMSKYPTDPLQSTEAPTTNAPLVPTDEVCALAKTICSEKCKPHGFVSGPDDCLYCSCNKTSSQDDEINITSGYNNTITHPCVWNLTECSLQCPRGYLTGPRECQICSCK